MRGGLWVLNSIFLLIPVFFPVITGALLLLFKPKTEKVRRVYVFTCTLLTSIFTIFCLIYKPEEEFVFIALTSTIDLSFKLDGLGIIFASLIALLWPFACLYAFDYMKHSKNTNLFYAFYVMTFGVTMGVAFSGNALTMYLFYEFLTLVTTPLVLFTQTREAVKASRKYLYYSISGAAIGFIAIIFVMVLGYNSTFSFGGIIPHAALKKELLHFAYILAFIGFGAKAAVFPLHAWLPSASVAPTPVTALLHAVAVVKAGAFVIMRMTYYVFGADLISGSYAQIVVLGLVGFTVIYGSIKAIKEQNFKRRLAYSTISNLSYILLGVVMMSSFGFYAALCHMIFHAFMKITAFFCAGAVLEHSSVTKVHELEGIAKNMPFIFTCFAISALSLCGMPPFLGFISKYSLITAGIENGTWIGYTQIIILVLASVMSVIYLLFIVIRAFFPREDAVIAKAHDPSILMKLPIGLFACVVAVLGFFAQPLLVFLTKVSQGNI